MSLQDFWRALTARDDLDDDPSVMGGACFYNVATDKAMMDALTYGTGVIEVKHVPVQQLGCDNGEIIREVRQLQSNETDINPISGIPYSDKERKEWQLDTFMFDYFPDGWLAIVQVAIAGNRQHNPGQPLHWAREKSTDQFNTAFRHYWERRRGVRRDTDGQYHLAKAAWRIMAQLQLDIEEDRRRDAVRDNGTGT